MIGLGLGNQPGAVLLEGEALDRGNVDLHGLEILADGFEPESEDRNQELAGEDILFQGPKRHLSVCTSFT